VNRAWAVRVARETASALAAGAVLLLAASALVFVLLRSAPGDAVDIEFSESGAASYLDRDEAAAAQRARRHDLGLDGSTVAQYASWLSAMARGDFGVSFRSGRPVATELGERLPASLLLGTAGFAVAAVIGTGAAVLAARRPGSVVDHLVRVGMLGAVAMPAFLSGSLAIAVAARWGGYAITGPASLDRLWLPALVLGTAVAPTFSRVLRASLVAERSRPYALAARARGSSPATVTRRHILRPALSPVLTLAGLALASLLGGSVITEAVFAWPGVGAYAVSAIRAQDHPVVQAYVVLVTLLVVGVNRLVDVAQRLLDPRQGAAA
jgi:ABC-type dipeptide/oligopeptide/nickel transport system permease component